MFTQVSAPGWNTKGALAVPGDRAGPRLVGFSVLSSSDAGAAA